MSPIPPPLKAQRQKLVFAPSPVISLALAEIGAVGTSPDGAIEALRELAASEPWKDWHVDGTIRVRQLKSLTSRAGSPTSGGRPTNDMLEEPIPQFEAEVRLARTVRL